MGRNKHKGKFRSIPEGWVGCPPMATGFIDDRFFVFKTPLKPALNSQVSKVQRFAPENVFEQVKQMNNSKLGLWIDLTNTTRYYDPSHIQQFQHRGIQYEKLSCDGHGRPPSRYTIHQFCGIVHNFFRRNHQDYVAVHCTHGFNRTGFLICCYLIRFRKYNAAEAVQEFAKHRQPGIYRQRYVNELYTMTYPVGAPPQVAEPLWVHDTNSDSNQSSTSDNNASSGDGKEASDNEPSTSTSTSSNKDSDKVGSSSTSLGTSNPDVVQPIRIIK